MKVLAKNQKRKQNMADQSNKNKDKDLREKEDELLDRIWVLKDRKPSKWDDLFVREEINTIEEKYKEVIQGHSVEREMKDEEIEKWKQRVSELEEKLFWLKQKVPKLTESAQHKHIIDAGGATKIRWRHLFCKKRNRKLELRR